MTATKTHFEAELTWLDSICGHGEKKIEAGYHIGGCIAGTDMWKY